MGAEVFLKCENLQRAGAFKIRGAYNTASRLSQQQLAKGLAAYSSGNQAQAGVVRFCRVGARSRPLANVKRGSVFSAR